EVALLLPVIAAEGAERAVLDADVGEVDVAVDHVGHDVAGLSPTHLVRDERQREEVAAVDVREPDALVDRHLPAVEDASEDPADIGGGPVEIDRCVHDHQVLHVSSSGFTGPSGSVSRPMRSRSCSSTKSGRLVYSG